MTIVYEVTIQVRSLCAKMLFSEKPTLGRICECVSIIFADNEHIEHGMIELLLSIGDDEDRHGTTFEIGDQVNFTEDDLPIGYMDLKTRTLFHA